MKFRLPKMSELSGNTVVRLALSLLLTNLIIAALSAFLLHQNRTHFERRAEAETRNLAQTLANEIRSDIRSIDLGLMSVVDEMERQYGAGGIDSAILNTFVEQQHARLSKLDGLRVTDADGNVVYGTRVPRDPILNLTDRDYYRRLRTGETSGLAFSKPMVSRHDGRWVLKMARRISYLDGTFAGISYGTISLTSFSKAFSALDIGKNGAIALFDDNLTLLARHPAPSASQTAIGAPLVSAPLRAMFAAGREAATARAFSSVDGIERIFSYRSIPETSLNVMVGVATETYLANWRIESAKTLGIIFVLLCLPLSLLVYRAVRGQHVNRERIATAKRAAEAEKEMNRIIVDSSPLAIYTRDKTGLVTAWNHACESMFGWKAEEVIGKMLPTVPPGKEDESEELRRQILERDRTIQTEVQRRRRDGTLIDLITTLSPLRNASGEIEGYLAIAADITERKAAERKVEFLAHHDVLTELPNRVLVQDRFLQAVAFAEREGKKVALVFFDLDHFKAINDSLGHSVGDELLKEIASRLQGSMRNIDTISRQGGDEFLIVLSNLPDAEIVPTILAKYRRKLQEPFYIDGNELPVSMSIGIAVYPDDGDNFDTLLKKADMAMYRAKEAGRNTYRFFDEQMNVEAIDNLVVRTGLRRALERDEFVLYYEPQFDLATGAVVGAEALIRWRHPEHGLVAPARFIHIAEESGLIVPIGEWVVHEACRQAVAWRKAGLPEMTIAVNLSVMQFKRGDLEKTIIHALKASGLDPRCLELELTESLLIQDVDNVLLTIQELKSLGIKLSIDDFGTGYSSLSYLKRLDVDKLKIDQSFIRDLATDADDRAIVNAIVQMARSLNLRTMAEGVETPEVLAILRDLGCEEGQGYHFAAPLAAPEFTEFLVASTRSAALDAGTAGY